MTGGRAQAMGKPRGFSLMEVLMASTVLLVGAAGVFMGMTAATGTESRLLHLTVASQVAEGVAEALLTLPGDHEWLEVGAHTDGEAPLHFDESGAPAEVGRSRYRATWTVTSNRTPGANLQGIRRIDIVVRWRALGKEQQTQWRVHRR